MKNGGREEAIRYEAFTELVLKGYSNAVSIVVDMLVRRLLTPKPVIKTEISLGDVDECGGFATTVGCKGGTVDP